jgi:hypothetical protein
LHFPSSVVNKLRLHPFKSKLSVRDEITTSRSCNSIIKLQVVVLKSECTVMHIWCRRTSVKLWLVEKSVSCGLGNHALAWNAKIEMILSQFVFLFHIKYTSKGSSFWWGLELVFVRSLIM